MYIVLTITDLFCRSPHSVTLALWFGANVAPYCHLIRVKVTPYKLMIGCHSCPIIIGSHYIVHYNTVPRIP